MFAYCLNDPINYKDSSGSFVIEAIASAEIVTVVGKILFDLCVSVLATAAAWEIGQTITEGVKSVLSEIQATLTAAARSKQQSRIRAAIIESFEKTGTRDYRSDTELHHIVAHAAPNAQLAREILTKVGIGINSTFNTVE